MMAANSANQSRNPITRTSSITADTSYDRCRRPLAYNRDPTRPCRTEEPPRQRKILELAGPSWVLVLIKPHEIGAGIIRSGSSKIYVIGQHVLIEPEHPFVRSLVHQNFIPDMTQWVSTTLPPAVMQAL